MRCRPNNLLLALAFGAFSLSGCGASRTSDPIPSAGDVLVGIAGDALEEHYECDPFTHRPGELDARDPQCKEDIRKSVQRELNDAGRRNQQLESAKFRQAFDEAVKTPTTKE